MQVIPIVGSVVGATTSSHWAQTIKTSFIYGVVEIQSEIDNAQAIGMQTISSIIEGCSKPTANEITIDAIVRKAVTPETQSIILFVPIGLQMHVIIGGKGAVYVKREGQYAKLLDTSGATSGTAQKGDVFILLSEACRNILSEQELFGIFDHLSADVLAEKLTLLLQKKDAIYGCAALLFEVKDMQEGQTVFSQPPQGFSKVSRFLRLGRTYQIASIKRHVLVLRHAKQTPGMFITILLIVIFLTSIIAGIRRELLVKRDTKMQTVIQESERMYEEGQALLELNAVKGRERLMSAKALLAPVADIVTDKTKEERQVSELYSRIVSTLTTAMHIYTQEPQLFYDVGLLKLGGVISTMGIWGDRLIIGDTSQKAVYTLTISSKTGAIIGGGNGFNQIYAVDAQGDIIYVLTSDGINQITVKSNTNTLQIIKKGNEWGTVQTMVVFGGNIYLLDTKNSRIWKYVASETGFSDIKEFLNPDTLPDLSRAQSMAIDGSVWLGTSDGNIQRFTQGKENTFVSKGVDPPFGKNLRVYLSDETKNLYILDGDNKRVVVTDKEGMYLAQYTWSGDIFPSQLVVAEKQGKILLLAAGKLYSIDLK